MQPSETANPIDVHVGARLRERRLALGLSQERLADDLGLTLQQIQTYERGADRVSSGKLFEIARILDTPVWRFFDGLPGGGRAATIHGDERQAGRAIHDFLLTAEGLEMAALFSKIGQPAMRRRVLDLVRAMADEPGDAEVA